MTVEYFVGRRDELARFAVLLAELAVDGLTGSRWRCRLRRQTGSQAGDARSRVLLVHGLGGSGKSRLLRQFREMALDHGAGGSVLARSVGVVLLDWEDEERDDPGSFAGVAGPSLVTVLDAVQKAFISGSRGSMRAAERAGRAFGDYRQGAARMPEYAARFADVVAQSMTPESPFTGEDTAALLKAALSTGLLAVGHPGGLLGLTPTQITAATQASGRLSAAATRAVTGKKPGEVSPQEYELITDPAGELIRRVAAGIREMASRQPLVILLDTGEIIGDRAWGWLRRVMAQTGPRVAWVVGARFETEAEAGPDSPVAQFIRDIGDMHLLLMSPTRFDDAMIRSYLENRQNANSLTKTEIDLIAGFTRGLPLAVSFTATLLDQGQSVQEACRELEDGYPSNAVSRLARRYLVHAEQQTFPADDPRRDDVTKILGLALALGDLRNDPELLAALWNVEPAEVQAVFADLATRHDFVLPGSRRLHDDVRDTLRTDLLDPFQRAHVEQLNRRALTLLSARLDQMRYRWPALDDQITHAAFSTIMLAVLWHTLWADNQEGLDLFIHMIPILAVVDSPTAAAATAIIERFEATFNQDQLADLDQLTKTQPSGLFDNFLLGRGPAVRNARQVSITLSGLALKPPGIDLNHSVMGEPSDRLAAALILGATLSAGKNDAAAVSRLRQAAPLTRSARIRDVIGSQAQAIGNRVLWESQSPNSTFDSLGLKAIKLATEMLPYNARAWESYGAVLDTLGQMEDAQAAHDQARRIDPEITVHFAAHVDRASSGLDDERASRKFIALISNRFKEAPKKEAPKVGYQIAPSVPNDSIRVNSPREASQPVSHLTEVRPAYGRTLKADSRDSEAFREQGGKLMIQGRYEEALAAYDRAGPSCHNSRAEALRYLRRYEEALTAYDQALAIDPSDPEAFKNPGLMLIALGRNEEALAAYDQALKRYPGATAHENKGIALSMLGYLDRALAQFDAADRLQPDGVGEGRTWAGAILWHLQDAAAAQRRFALVENRVSGRAPFRVAEMEAIALCGLGRPKAGEKRLIGANPSRGISDGVEPREIYDLLTNPPMAGVDRLRNIVSNYSVRDMLKRAEQEEP